MSPGASILPGRARKQGRAAPRAARPSQPGLRLASRPGCPPGSAPLSIISEWPWGRCVHLNPVPPPPALPTPGRGSGDPGCSRPVSPLCQGYLGPVRPGACGQRHPGQGRVHWGPGGASRSRAFRAGPPHDGSIPALKPAGLSALGRDPALPSAPWPCSPLSVAAAPETPS